MARKMVRKSNENSKIGRTLESLAKEGVDCIKIIPSCHKYEETIYLALGRNDDDFPYTFKEICEICNSLDIDYMEIEPKKMIGRYIKEDRDWRGLNPIPKHNGIPIKIDQNKCYNVLSIKYIFPKISEKNMRKISF